MEHDCLFCALSNPEDPTRLVWQNDIAAAFYDIHPKAPVHVLVVPRKHVYNLDDLEDEVMAGRLLMAVREVAAKVGLTGRYRLSVNNGKPVGQVVPHLHFHLLGAALGQAMALPDEADPL